MGRRNVWNVPRCINCKDRVLWGAFCVSCTRAIVVSLIAGSAPSWWSYAVAGSRWLITHW